jgi:serine/threonine protein kinase
MGCCCSVKPQTKPKTLSIPPKEEPRTQRAVEAALNRPTTMQTYQRDIREDYTLGKVIGQGHFGTVRIAKQITSDKKFAVKTIEKKKVLKDLHILKREVEI